MPVKVFPDQKLLSTNKNRKMSLDKCRFMLFSYPCLSLSLLFCRDQCSSRRAVESSMSNNSKSNNCLRRSSFRQGRTGLNGAATIVDESWMSVSEDVRAPHGGGFLGERGFFSSPMSEKTNLHFEWLLVAGHQKWCRMDMKNGH
jgi:hypothetical protein